MFTTPPLPPRCFVSHSYGDAAMVEVLRTQLPRSVVPVIFPPIDARPDQFVSNVLIEEIQRCDAVIYLHGGASVASFWVAFEVEYAKRLGKLIFAFDPSRSVIELDQRPPLALDVFASYHRADITMVETATEYLARERGFDVWIDRDRLAAGVDWKEEITSNLTDRARRGYVVCFWSRAAQSSEWLNNELALAVENLQDASDRIVLGMLEPCQPPELFLNSQRNLWAANVVELYNEDGSLSAHRLDDLMVRLYWLLLRKSDAATQRHPI